MKRKKSGKSDENGSPSSASGHFFKWLAKLAFKLVIAGLAFMAVFMSLVYIGLFGKIPGEDELHSIRNHSASEVYSADDQLIGTFFLENRRNISNSDISEHVINALIATEDSRFFEHKGLDYVSMGRVLVHSVILGDKSYGGGSTISQQLAKNLYPRRDYKVLSLPVNKAREIFTASRLEDIYSKAEILNLYLNTVPFGENVYGIEVAANRFFSKPSSDLDPHEAATLVGMLAANTYFSPRLHPDRSIERRNIVLDRMMEQGFLSEEDGLRYQEMSLELNYRILDRNNGPASYFMEHIRRQAERILEEQYNDSIDLHTDGLRLYTTLDSRLQSFANEALNSHLVRLQDEFDRHWKGMKPWQSRPEIYVSALKNSSRYQALSEQGLSETEIMEIMEIPMDMVIREEGKEKQTKMSPADSVAWSLKQLQAGFLAANPANGHVLAWVGGPSFKFFPYDHVRSRRQVGSTFKPFVYATALEEGYEPCDYINNEQRTYRRYDDWSPSNTDGEHEGFYSLQGGLVHSVNTVTAELTVETGPHDVAALARNAGIESAMPDVPSIGLGTANLSLLEMVQAYTAFANYGNGIELQSLLRIEDARGEVLYDAQPAKLRDAAFSEKTGRYMVHFLKGVVERGTARSLNRVYGLETDLAGKTGTTQDHADGWFIGFSPGLVAGAWVGADHPGIRFRSLDLGQGSHTALPVFARFMQKVERSGTVSDIGRRSFYPLPEDLQARVECPDFSEEDPDIGFFERLFGGDKKEDKQEEKQKQEERKEKEEEEDDGKTLLDKMKDIFRKKD
ncbi:MAG: transglycosylase domain-containing protein [Marinilabilia sp.]